MAHSKQMISDFANSMNPDILRFYAEHEQEFEVPLMDFVENLLDSYFSIPDAVSISDSADKLRRRQWKTKKRWYDAYLDSQEKYPDISHKRNPFNIIYSQKNSLRPEQWQMLYGDSSTDDVINRLREEIAEWKDTKQSEIFRFPLIQTKRTSPVYSAISIDAALNIYHIIKKDYGGNLTQFYRYYPEELVDKPLFSPNSHNIMLEKYAGKLIDDFELGNFDEHDNVSYHLLTTTKPETSDVMRVFDSTDMTIISAFLANVDTSFITTKQVTLDLADITKVLYDGTPSEWHYDQAAKRCMELTQRHYEFVDSNRKNALAFNFFDHVNISVADESGRRKVSIVFGELLSRAIVDRKLISVTSRNYDSLENPLSKILYYTLQRERVNLGLINEKDSVLKKNYDYAFFNSSVRFHTRKKTQNIKLINEALDEFSDKGIAIYEYIYSAGGKWQITYLPLSDEEYEDLQFESASPSIVSEQE